MMKRLKKLLHLCMCICIVLFKCHLARTQQISVVAAATASNKPEPTYFFMDVNGSYRYAFDTGSGIKGEQVADQANEVTGHYTYYEKGVPYMVKYRAGVQGYQPQVIPTTSNGAGGSGGVFGEVNTPQSTVLAQIRQSLVSRGGGGAAVVVNNNHLATQQTASALQGILPSIPSSSAGSTLTLSSSGIQPTLQFVQNAVKAMQTQPIQLSFNSQHGSLQHITTTTTTNNANNNAARLSPLGPTTTPPLQIQEQRINNAEIQQINSMLESDEQEQQEQLQPKRPYEFSYLADQSARTESSDKDGNVEGKYSYYDEAGFHDLTYKAGNDIGFVILGGSLAKSANTLENRATTAAISTKPTSELVVNVSQLPPHGSYNFKVSPLGGGIVAGGDIDTNTIKNNYGRSLRKFRRDAKE